MSAASSKVLLTWELIPLRPKSRAQGRQRQLQWQRHGHGQRQRQRHIRGEDTHLSSKLWKNLPVATWSACGPSATSILPAVAPLERSELDNRGAATTAAAATAAASAAAAAAAAAGPQWRRTADRGSSRVQVTPEVECPHIIAKYKKGETKGPFDLAMDTEQ